MPRVFALADLHLSLVGDKPMDRFGEIWRDHARRMAEAWDARVAEEDTVLLPGDLSWGRTLAEAAPDLAWIGARPGRKLLLRGNHDGWWSSLSRVAEALPERCEAFQHAAVEIGDWILVGTRGWTAPDHPWATPEDGPVYRRELERLRLSLDAARRFDAERPRLAMTHFPPLVGEEPSSEVSRLLRQAGVRVCVYGHLHGVDQALAVRGERDGIRFVFVAADAVSFTPAVVLESVTRSAGA